MSTAPSSRTFTLQPLISETALLRKILYRSTNQHRRTFYFQRTKQVLKLSLKIISIVENREKSGITTKSISKSKDIVEKCDKLVDLTLKAASLLSEQIHHGFFITLCLVILGCLAKIREMVVELLEIEKTKLSELEEYGEIVNLSITEEHENLETQNEQESSKPHSKIFSVDATESVDEDLASEDTTKSNSELKNCMTIDDSSAENDKRQNLVSQTETTRLEKSVEDKSEMRQARKNDIESVQSIDEEQNQDDIDRIFGGLE